MNTESTMPPTGSLEVIHQALNDISALDGPSLRLHSLQAGRHIGKPMPVYSVGLEDAAEGRSSRLSQPAAWRYLVTSDEFDKGPMALVDVRPNEYGKYGTDEGVRFASLRRGPWALSTTSAVQQGREYVEDGRESVPHRPLFPPFSDYIVSILEIPQAMVSAVWLRSKDALADVFVPFSPNAIPWRPMDTHAFNSWAAGIARQQIGVNRAFDAQVAEPSPKSGDAHVKMARGFLPWSDDAQLLHERGLLALALGDLLQAIGHVRSDEPVFLIGPELLMHAEQAAEWARSEAAAKGLAKAKAVDMHENEETLRGLLASLEGLRLASLASPNAAVTDAIERSRHEVWSAIQQVGIRI